MPSARENARAGPDNLPLDRDAYWSQAEIERFDRRAARIGLRLFPYPYGAIAAVFSDCDYSTVGHTVRNWWELCFQRNLDWGESVYLTCEPDGSEAAMVPPLRRPRQSAALLAQTHAEIAALANWGFIDHFHGIAQFQFRPPSAVEISLELCQQKADGYQIDGIRSLVDALDEETSAHIREHRLGSIYFEYEDTGDQGECDIQFANGPLVRCRAADSWCTAQGRRAFELRLEFDPSLFADITLANVDWIHIHANSKPSRILLLSLGRSEIRKQFEELARAGTAIPPLLTDHAATGFLTASSFEHNHARHNATGADAAAPLKYHAYMLPDGTSLLPDAAEGPLAIGETLDRFGVYFINPSGSSGESRDAIHPMQALARAYRRDGKPVYVARRILPRPVEELVDPDLPAEIRRKSRVTTFAPRVQRALNVLDASDGPLAFPIYTHLGADQAWEHRECLFDGPEIAELQDRVFNFSGRVDGRVRLYLIRPSAFCEYLRIISQVADHTKRTGPNNVAISSWLDDHLGIETPASEAQLHGMTFRVDSAVEGRISLDGHDLPDLLRIGRHLGIKKELDEEWVSVLSGGIRQRIDIDPATRRSRPGQLNLLGNVMYVGIRRTPNAHGSGSAPWGVTIRGESGFRLYVGSPELGPDWNSVNGTILVDDWAMLNDATVWFSLATARWTFREQRKSVDCFGRSLNIQVIATPGDETYCPVETVLMMKPSTTATGEADTAAAESFGPWLHCMLDQWMAP